MFSQKQIQEFKEAFGIIDVDKDGIITAKDLKDAFVSIGRPISDAEANNLVGEAPGPINFTQMVTLFAEKMAGGKCVFLELTLRYQVPPRQFNSVRQTIL